MFASLTRRCALSMRGTPEYCLTQARCPHSRSYYAASTASYKMKETESPPPTQQLQRTHTQKLHSKRALQAHVIPHPDKGGNCEDAHFICEKSHSFGVADGVGVWSELGINSGVYSATLLRHVREFLQQNPKSSLYDALLHGYTETLKEKTEGSSTVVLAKVVGRELHGLHLGDSALAVFRNNEMIYKSEEQCHSFNYPFQLGTGGDSPSKAHCIQCATQKDDLVVLATDGLFDNLYPEEMTEVLDNSAPDKLAMNLAVSATAAACSDQKETPFSERVAEQTDQIWSGGKMDDITVVVYRVQ